MQAASFACAAAAAVFLTACSTANPPAPAGAPAAVATGLSGAQKAAIGRKIWQNESGGTVNGLTAWNSGEGFPSLGIGHFIWYPAGQRGPFEESWPQFVAFAQAQGANPPAVARQRHSPWTTKAEFQRQFNGPELSGLRTWLAGNIGVQTDYIISRSRGALPKILAAAPPSERAKIEANYRKVATTPQGTYALIDYVNFKGEGIQATERYNGMGWGLMQVLGNMREVPAGPAAASEFAASAKRMLSRRVQNAPAARNEGKWLPGWHNRCDTYARPL
ncbi:MAG: hypothetical protein KF712_09700 [Akkermansiaceae bacterium]|nr:hypothetical protein [Akkermansiaceae bacterium]